MFVHVTVTPGAKKERVTKSASGRYTIEVREEAERNLANERVRVLVARECGVVVGAVRIIAGHRSRTKVMSVG